MSLETLSQQLYDSGLSTWIREVTWIIPTVQSVHILAIAVLVGSALVMDLRLAGVLSTEEPAGTVVRRYLPWLWGGLALLLATGTTMVVGEPDRVLTNAIFWYKMGLVLSAFVLTLLFRYPILHPDFQIEHARWARAVKPLAWVSLAVWVAVIYCGRWIAYAI